MITSVDNPKVKWMRSLLEPKGRRREQCYLIEGPILLDEALAAAVTPRLVLFSSAALQVSRRGRHVLERLAALPGEEVSDAVLQRICNTTTPQGVVAALPMPSPPTMVPPGGLVVVLDGVRDPANVGTILRSADAANCTAVLATPGTADLFGPKVVRGAMGAHLRLMLAPDVSWPRLQELMRGRAVYVAVAHGGQPYHTVDWTQPAALIIGNETEGPRPEALGCAQGRISIPMPGRAESLNAAVAASIIIFETVRQTLLSKGV